MNDRITQSFLEGNLFEEAKVASGFHPWFYEEKKKFKIIISTGDCYIWCRNYENGQEIDFKVRPNMALTCTKTNLKRCLEFLNIEDEFDYNL